MGTLLIATPSSSAPGDPIPGESDLPPSSPPISGAGQGVVTLSQGAVARKAKLYITIGPDAPLWGLLYVGLNNSPPEDPTSYKAMCRNTATSPPCLPDPFYQPACATDDPATQQKGNFYRSAIYPVQPLARGVDAGLLAKIPVRMVAFGSIPASATLTMRLVRVNGKLQPMTAQSWGFVNLAKARGCDPSFRQPSSSYVNGQVTLSISDVVVDGVPVEVGTKCRTVDPVDLGLWNENASYTPGGGGPLGAYDGLHPGSLRPLDSPYYQELNGKSLAPSTGLTIPSFTGCVAKGEDLSPLITAMASGSNNPVRVVQKSLTPFDEGPDLTDIRKCTPVDPDDPAPPPPLCPLPAPDAPERPPLPAGEE